MQAKMERVEAEQRRMAEILQYMQSLGAATGVAPPPSLFAPPPPPPPHYSTPVSINVLVCMFMLTVKPSGVWKFYSCIVYIYLISHMQSLLLCVESIGGIERSSCFSESFTKSVMILVVVNGTSICNCGWRWWSTWITCKLICDILWDMRRLWYICDICDIYVVLVIYMWCWWYICDVGDVCYIYLLFVWMGCKK